MAIVTTDLRNTRQAAHEISFLPGGSISATNVQDAIDEVAAAAIAAPGYTPRVVTFAMSPYTPVLTDTVLLVDTTGGAVVVSLPLSATRLTDAGYVPLTVKDDVGNSQVNAISVNRAGAELIDGLSAYPIDTQYQSVTFQPKATGGWDAV